MELSCPAASTQPCMEFRTACTDAGDLLGDNCSDLLCGSSPSPIIPLANQIMNGMKALVLSQYSLYVWPIVLFSIDSSFIAFTQKPAMNTAKINTPSK